MSDLFPLKQLEDHPQPEPDSWAPVNLNDLPDKPPTKPTLGNSGLLYPGKRHVFSGPPDSAKTIAAYCILIATIRAGGSAVLIDFEMGGYDARQRLLELGADTQELRRVHYIEPFEPATPERIDTLIALEPTLVVVDAAAGAYDLEGLDDDKRRDVEKLTRLYVKRFWRNGIATLFIDHVVKNAENRGRFMIGSERKLGGVDVSYGFDTITPVSRGTTGRYKLIINRDRGGYLKRGHVADLHLESDPDTHHIAWTFNEATDDTAEAGYFRPTHLMEKVSIHLELQSEPATRNQIAAAIGGAKDYVLKAINALVTEGFAHEHDGPNRSKLVESARRYRETDPTCNPENTTGGSVVLCGSTVVSDHQWFGGSGGSPHYVGETTDHHHTDHPNQLGWFDTNGHLTEAPFDPAWAESVAPDPDPEPDDDIPF
jgi:hypothetical protein